MEPSQLRELVRSIPDYPIEGVVFKDITPVLADAQALSRLVDLISAPYKNDGVTSVVGIEARGFTLAVPVALTLGASFVPFRKPGKLPYRVKRQEFMLEYGTDALEAHEDAIAPNDKVLIVDDVIATGGTAGAAIRMVESFGAQAVGMSVFIELEFLKGREQLGDVELHSVVTYA